MANAPKYPHVTVDLSRWYDKPFRIYYPGLIANTIVQAGRGANPPIPAKELDELRDLINSTEWANVIELCRNWVTVKI